MLVNNIEPCDYHFAVTKSDTTVYSPPIEVLFVGSAGDVALILAESDDAIVYQNVQNGQEIYRKIKKVMATNTTAGDFVGSRRKR